MLQSIVGVDAVTDNPEVWSATAASLWLFLYWWVSIAVAGKTIGKALLGLRVVSRDGAILTSARSALRAVSLPFSYLLFGLGFLGIVFGRERRALHDVVAGSAVVYDWGPRTAELPTPISAYLAKKAAAGSEPGDG